MTLDWQKVQEKWQKRWTKAKLGEAIADTRRPKFFMIFAYPGISGFLHVGHMRGFSYTDAICRYERLQGKQVLFPVGTHASGNQAIAFANKVRNNDEVWINYLKKNGCPEDKIAELSDPQKIIAYFNEVYVNDYWKKFGFLCDWQRFTCTTFPDYEKFIQWQFKKLQQRDLLVQKPYFAPYSEESGPVAIDPSETDLSKGGNAEKIEYTLLKFKFSDDFLVAATLRAETIYGQTNLWINPEAKYVRVEVEGEDWIISEQTAEKLRYQKDDVILKENIDPKKLIGRKALAPGIDREIIILPAEFCDPAIGTGIVTSVPSDAPFDYVALTTLQKNDALITQYGLDVQEVKEITPIPIINMKSYGNLPAKELVEKLGIIQLKDENLNKATKELYKAGHHTGIMRENCGKYAGMKVEEAKELMKAELLEEGKADVLHDLSEEVICRNGGKVFIKRIDDQWFIRYSDPELTERSKNHVKEMRIFPKEYHEHMPATLDWFNDRACVRLGNWLGSRFPFDDKWIVEPISDSTLYPAYYIVAKYVNEGSLTVEDLTEEFFDYIFLGQGEGKDSWKKIREEFDYFYPLDINLGGKEHKTVHFPVFLMNHVAVLPPEKWPRGIFANWWVTGKGSKISKSKGGAEPIPEAIEKYGVDAMRLYYAHIGSPHVDVVWTEKIVLNYKNALERIYSLAEQIKGLDDKKKAIDAWLLSRIHGHVKNCNEAMKSYDLRELASIVYFTFYDDLRWYVRRGGEHKKTMEDVLTIWCRLMNPVTPHISEELNQTKELISMSDWPVVDEDKIRMKTHAAEEMIKEAMYGMRNVMKLADVEQPKRFTLFIAESWRYELFTLLAHLLQVTRNPGEIMKEVLKQEEMKMRGKDVSKLVLSIVKDASKLPHIVTSQEDELKVMQEAKQFLEKEFSCDIKIVRAEESDEAKAKAAMPGRVGVLVE